MIQKLNHKDDQIAFSILNVQIPAYKVEAKLIGFDGIPQLKDDIQSIKTSSEIFIGYMLEDQLVAFISYSEDDHKYQICRLVVHPTYFKKGIARKLVKYFLEEVANQKKRVIVSTGADNSPAIRLYESEGFDFLKKIEVAPNFFISFFECKSNIAEQ